MSYETRPANERWSPFEIHVLLHHYASTGPFERKDAPAYREAIDKFTSIGLCEPASHIPCKVTPLGAALVKMWCETPIPEVRYVDPRIAA